MSCKNVTSKKDISALYAPYFKKCDSIVSKLDSEANESRKSDLMKLKKTDFYKRTVVNKEVKAKNLNVLHVISSAIIGSSEKFFTASALEFSSLEPDENTFVSLVCSLNCNGGVPIEIVEVFDDYKEKFKYLGRKGSIYYNAIKNTTDTTTADYDISPFFVMIDINDKKAIDAVFEAHLLGIRNWYNANDYQEDLILPFLAFQGNFHYFLEKNYPESKYFLDYKYSGEAASLISEYQANEVAADKKYKNNGILLKGVVVRVMKDIADNNIVVIAGDNMLSSVHCKVSESDALRVSQRQRILILGQVKGMILNSVMLDKCQIFNPKSMK